MNERISINKYLARPQSQTEARRQGNTNPCSRASVEKDSLVHDLQIHQIELEMQNEELRKAQEQLSEIVEKYSDLYDFSPVGYVTSNRSGLILEMNLTFADQLGRERASLINTPLWLNVAINDRNRIQAHLDQTFTTSEHQTIELCLRKKNDQETNVQLDSIRVITLENVAVCRTSVTDISARKKAENELVQIHNQLERRVQERTAELFVNERKFRILSNEFQVLLNAITDTMILFSPGMKVLWTNSRDAEHLNKKDSDAENQYCHLIIHDKASFPLDNPISRCFETGEKEIAIATHNGTIMDLRAFPIKDAKKVNSVLLLVSDITEKMSTQAEALQAAQMASLGELASGVAHEINNPITGIINYGQMLINESHPNSLEKDIGTRIVKEGDRIATIVRTLLSYARDGREEKRSTKIESVLTETILLTKAQIRKEGIVLKIDSPDNLPTIHANLQQLQQAFINIINNARYALNEKYPDRHENKRLEISVKETVLNGNPYVRTTFHDKGGGVSAADIPLLTKQFYSTKPSGKGTGLGLNITEKIITDHGGYLSFKSSLGMFTTVTIDFPVAQNR